MAELNVYFAKLLCVCDYEPAFINLIKFYSVEDFDFGVYIIWELVSERELPIEAAFAIVLGDIIAYGLVFSLYFLL